LSIKEGSETDVMQAIRERRSIGRYPTEAVTEEAFRAVVEAARRTQSLAATALSYETRALQDSGERHAEQ